MDLAASARHVLRQGWLARLTLGIRLHAPHHWRRGVGRLESSSRAADAAGTRSPEAIPVSSRDRQPLQGSDMIAEMRRIQALIDAAPPVPHVIMAHHAVPYGAAFRQWDTRGRLLVWANRGQIADMPRAEKNPNLFAASPIAAFGIPVVNA